MACKVMAHMLFELSGASFGSSGRRTRDTTLEIKTAPRLLQVSMYMTPVEAEYSGDEEEGAQSEDNRGTGTLLDDVGPMPGSLSKRGGTVPGDDELLSQQLQEGLSLKSSSLEQAQAARAGAEGAAAVTQAPPAAARAGCSQHQGPAAVWQQAWDTHFGCFYYYNESTQVSWVQPSLESPN